LATSTVLTLVIVPVVYSLFADWHEHQARKKEERAANSGRGPIRPAESRS
jgi:antibiotic biosynthesis monooxygenase (ABM) superfamily enzyme